jgi:hypothetical protein
VLATVAALTAAVTTTVVALAFIVAFTAFIVTVHSVTG